MLRLSLAAVVFCAFPLTSLADSDAGGGDPRPLVRAIAMERPVDDAGLSAAPQLGDSVPERVEVVVPDEKIGLGYFYHAGQPVIVHMGTRSVVAIGNVD